MARRTGMKSHSSHWGSFVAGVVEGELVVSPENSDENPSPLLENIPRSVDHKTRISQPHVRRAWLTDGPGARSRDDDDFVPVDWDTALDLVAADLERVRQEYGNEAIFGGSYGWSSAGRFHHAQSQLHRFLNCIGGYTRSVNSYSLGAAEVIMPRVLATALEVVRNGVTWEDAAQTELIVTFGGASKNFQVASGGLARHEGANRMAALRANGCEIVTISPLADDFEAELTTQHISIRPFGDVPLMLALAFELITKQAYDQDFVERCTVGFDTFARYVLGESDGVPKNARWASELSGIDPAVIAALAAKMSERRTIINVSYSLQRSRHGEQPVWLAIALAALLGQIGLPGGGFAFGLGSMGNNGAAPMSIRPPAFSQGANPIDTYVPVAKFSDMMLNPGGEFDYNGLRLKYPKIRLVYWAGGNPFHHSQNINRLRRAFERPETVVVHDPFWTATARSADIVLPSTITLERNDFGAGHGDTRVIAMKQVLEPYGAARDDYAILRDLAVRMGVAESFSEGRSADQWIRHLFHDLSRSITEAGLAAPSFDEFWAQGGIDIPRLNGPDPVFAGFRDSPEAHPLGTPSGRIEIYSATIAGFGYEDCPGHPSWIDTPERVTESDYQEGYLQLIANNPRSRLHSQLDMGATSQASKVAGREPVRVNPEDAARHGIADGDVVVLYNDRGGCLAGAVLSDSVSLGTAQLSTGAWYQPGPIFNGLPLCIHGNPNVLTSDEGTSSLAQASAGQLTKVRIERYEGEPPEVTVTSLPPSAVP